MYIRTKDGNIYSVAKVRDDILVNTEKGIIRKVGYVVNELPISKCIINEEDIISKADTIKELCDEFVYINKVGNMEKSHIVFEMLNRITEPTTKQKMDYIKKHYKDELDKIRGAIYTDKGLIYVAKMNDKGELELI